MTEKEVQKVFVIDAHGTPLLPTHPARSRILIRAGRAKVHQVVPHTIQLNRVVENPVGDFTVGIDDGAKEVGIGVVNEHLGEVVFQGVIKLRQDVSRKMIQRSQYRRTRRSRKLRFRAPRFLNRGKKGFLSPTIRQKKESILRVVVDLKKRLNITGAVIEEGQFDTSLVAGKKLVGAEFQRSEYEGKQFRAKVLWRDKYKCQRCGTQDRLQAHHIQFKSRGGGNSPQNGITLCEKCHEELHAGLWVLTKKPRYFRYPAHLQAGKKHLKEIFCGIGLRIRTCFGWMTAIWRKRIGLEKAHDLDAVAMVCRNYKPKLCSKSFLVVPKRTKVWENNPSKKHSEYQGFRHWDLVKAMHRTRGVVIGSVRSLKKTVLTLRTCWHCAFPVSYNKSRVLWRFDGIVYI